MTRRLLAILLFGTLLVCTAAAVPMKVQVLAGKALVWQQQLGGWTAITDSLALFWGDSVFVDNGEEAEVLVGQGISIKLKGVSRIVLTGEELNLTVGLIEGQMFLRRQKPYEMNFFSVQARGCTFVPLGTAGAVKFTKLGEPSVAMLEGRMRVEAPGGAAAMVGPGEFVTFEVNNAFKQGPLPQPAIEALEQWSGVALDQSAAAVHSEGAVQGSGMASEVETVAGGDLASMVVEEPVVNQPVVEPPVQVATAQPPVETAAEPEQKKSRKRGAQQTASVGTSVTPSSQSAASSESAPKAGSDEQAPKAEKAEGEGSSSGGSNKPVWGISAGPVTVDNEQWTRIAFFGDIPIWKFGVGLDIELFMNGDGEFDKKGWDFSRDEWIESLTRKLVYVRFGHEPDPVFVKVGGINDVTLGYGFVMDRFTNMLHYPDEKKLGLQLYLNDLSPIGITLQTVVADFLDFRNDGGVVGGRLGVKPLKPTKMPILGGLQLAATYVRDINQYAGARSWDYSMKLESGIDNDIDNDGIEDAAYYESHYLRDNGVPLPDSIRQLRISEELYDTLVEHTDKWASRRTNSYAVLGLDASVPIISGNVVNLDVYGQYAMSQDPEGDDDSVATEGWGIGAPGVALSVGPFRAQVEYRHTSGLFTPGFFGPYYDDERLLRSPVSVKESRLIDESLNGIYGMVGMNISNVLLVSGSYQYLLSDNDSIDPDHRYEMLATVGPTIIEKIPKINRVEAFVYKTAVGSYDEAFFEKSPAMYWGYRLGFEVMQGAGLVWEARYGWELDASMELVKNNNIGIQASMTF